MLFPMLVLGIFTLLVRTTGIPFNQQGKDLDILSKLLTPVIIHQNSNYSVDWYEFVTNVSFSSSIVYLGIFIVISLFIHLYQRSHPPPLVL